MIKISIDHECIRRHKKIFVFLITVLVILVAQVVATLYQKSRYCTEYCCVEMSRDVEGFFEFLGINTYIVTGMKYTEGNDSFFQHHNNVYYGEWESGHMWCELDIFGLRISYEATSLMPKFRFDDYDVIQRCDGFFVDGEYTNLDETDNVNWENIKR